MLGYLHLRFPQNFLEVADTKLALSQQIENPQAREVAKTLIYLDKSHGISSTFPLLRRNHIQNPSE
jgi:hypothetical protein